MKEKKLSSIALIATLILSIAAIFTITPVLASEPYFAMKPEHIINNTPSEGQTFSFWLNISSTQNFVGYQFYIGWNRTYINATSLTETPPPAFTQTGGEGLDWDENATHGRVEKVRMDPNLVNITGTYTVARIDFEIILVPDPVAGEPDALIPIHIDYDNSFFSDDKGGMVVPYYTYDGDVFLKAVSPGPPTVYIEYPSPQANLTFPSPPDAVKYRANGTCVDRIFVVDVKIKGVAKAHDLWGWEFVMFYNTTLLDTLNVTEGPFLSSINDTMFIGKFGSMMDPAYINVTYEDNELKRPILTGYGKIHACALFTVNHTAPRGGGTLAQIKFITRYQSIYPERAWCWLDIGIRNGSTALADTWKYPPVGAIPHNVENGAFGACMAFPPPVGPVIDCYTGNKRKYGATTPGGFWITNYTGNRYDPLPPPGAQIPGNADSYQPQDLVELFANVTYNGDAVQNKPVQFEIQPYMHNGTPIELDGFPLSRVVLTDENGTASLTFRIPWPCVGYDPPLPWYFMCYQSVDIACQQVNDTLWFEACWYIWVRKVMVEPDPVSKRPYCQSYVNVTFTYERHCLSDLPVYFTVVVYDHQMTPIGTNSIGLKAEHGAWCSSLNSTYMLRVHIPKWALVGMPTPLPYWPYPAAYVNAFTFRCSLGGMPYCPEASDTFEIVK